MRISEAGFKRNMFIRIFWVGDGQERTWYGTMARKDKPIGISIKCHNIGRNI